MKKIIILFLLFFSTFITSNVSASTYNQGKLYEIYWQESKVGVFASDETYHSMDYNGIMIKSTIDNYIYYCIEPETYMNDKSEASTNSHLIYEGDSSIISNSRLNSTSYEQIELLAYYGYGYKDNNVDHTSKKWYGITQVMIWRILRPDINYVFKSTRYSAPNSNLFLEELEEMENLINNHNKVPSFSNSTIKVTKGKKIILDDENNVLNNFYINDSELFNYEIVNNQLIIETKEEGNLNISFEKQKVNNEFKFFKSLSLQDLVTRGNVKFNSASFNLIIEGKTINIKKIDKDKQEFNEKLLGTILEIYEEDNSLVREITINSENERLILPYGNYYLKEKEVSTGYKINEDLIYFEVNNTTNNIELIIGNEIIKGNLIINKTKGGSGELFVKEANAEFEIRQNNILVDKIVTDENGYAIINLPYGIYEVVQTKGSKGYVFEEAFEVKILEEKDYIYNIKNLRKSKLIILKIDDSTLNPIKGTLFNIYNVKNELIFSGETDENGILEVIDLEIGDYYIKEVEASKYYLLDQEIYSFKVTENGLEIKVKIKNERITGDIDFVKMDGKTGKKLANAKIEIYFEESNEMIFSGYTDEFGKINLNELQGGKYYLIEKEEPYGYVRFRDKIYFEIDEDKELIQLVLSNEKIEVPNTGHIDYLNLIFGIYFIIMMGFLKKYDN